MQDIAHLEASKHINFVTRILNPDVERFALFHNDAWRHERAVSVPQATVLPLCDGMQLWQKLA